jgi:hypothetical protein
MVVFETSDREPSAKYLHWLFPTSAEDKHLMAQSVDDRRINGFNDPTINQCYVIVHDTILQGECGRGHNKLKLTMKHHYACGFSTSPVAGAGEPRPLPRRRSELVDKKMARSDQHELGVTVSHLSQFNFLVFEAYCHCSFSIPK